MLKKHFNPKVRTVFEWFQKSKCNKSFLRSVRSIFTQTSSMREHIENSQTDTCSWKDFSDYWSLIRSFSLSLLVLNILRITIQVKFFLSPLAKNLFHSCTKAQIASSSPLHPFSTVESQPPRDIFSFFECVEQNSIDPLYEMQSVFVCKQPLTSKMWSLVSEISRSSSRVYFICEKRRKQSD